LWFHVQHLILHKNWHISFLLVAKSEILYIIVICIFMVPLTTPQKPIICMYQQNCIYHL
jgi:hypothetical protein